MEGSWAGRLLRRLLPARVVAPPPTPTPFARFFDDAATNAVPDDAPEDPWDRVLETSSFDRAVAATLRAPTPDGWEVELFGLVGALPSDPVADRGSAAQDWAPGDSIVVRVVKWNRDTGELLVRVSPPR